MRKDGPKSWWSERATQNGATIMFDEGIPLVKVCRATMVGELADGE